ncbi:MAG TPA: hypothetical protein VLO30_08200, partial [Chthoniobacterales bacterium]|nr:hypothetical protein [Chthoniobacterales bacterium]
MSSTIKAGGVLRVLRPMKPPWWARTFFLAPVLFVAVVLNNSELIFRSDEHEQDDYAANSLQVLRAKRFQETLGNYSRFGFHHPGPAFFYVYAGGEFIFSDAARLVASPFHAQLIALVALSAFFFAAAIALIARHLREARSWFLGIALLLAALHFGAVGKFFDFIPGKPAFFCLWPPCVLILPFLCF